MSGKTISKIRLPESSPKIIGYNVEITVRNENRHCKLAKQSHVVLQVVDK